MSISFILVFPFLSDFNRYRFAVAWCKTILYLLRIICGVRYEVIGREHLPETPVVILSNHQSSWETIFYYTMFYPLSPILKRELLEIPFWGWALRLQRPIAIDRSKPREAARSLLSQGVARIRQGNSVMVFPEGTRRRTHEVRRFSRGGARLAIAAGVPVLPIAHNAGYCWPPGKFLKRPGLIKVVIGQQLPSVGQSAEDLTEQAENWIRERVDAM